MIVTMYKLSTENGKPVKVKMGTITEEGGSLVTDSPSLAELITVPIFVGRKIDPKEQPAEFLENLHLAYRGAYFWASRAK
jgi:hypothetical protein